MSGSDVEYEVEKIIGHKTQRGVLRYHIKWKGYEEPTWTSATNCSCTDLINEYRSANPHAGGAAAPVTTESADEGTEQSESTPASKKTLRKRVKKEPAAPGDATPVQAKRGRPAGSEAAGSVAGRKRRVGSARGHTPVKEEESDDSSSHSQSTSHDDATPLTKKRASGATRGASVKKQRYSASEAGSGNTTNNPAKRRPSLSVLLQQRQVEALRAASARLLAKPTPRRAPTPRAPLPPKTAPPARKQKKQQSAVVDVKTEDDDVMVQDDVNDDVKLTMDKLLEQVATDDVERQERMQQKEAVDDVMMEDTEDVVAEEEEVEDVAAMEDQDGAARAARELSPAMAIVNGDEDSDDVIDVKREPAAAAEAEEADDQQQKTAAVVAAAVEDKTEDNVVPIEQPSLGDVVHDALPVVGGGDGEAAEDVLEHAAADDVRMETPDDVTMAEDVQPQPVAREVSVARGDGEGSVVGGEADSGFNVDDDEVEVAEAEVEELMRPVIRHFTPANDDDDVCVVAEVDNSGITAAAATISNQRQKRFGCPKCSSRFITQATLSIHLNTAHQHDAGHTTIMEELGIPRNATIHICKNCCLAFTTREQKIAHAQGHGLQNSFLCETCSGFTYNTELMIKHHQLVQEGKVGYVCGQCSIQFDNDSALHEHSHYVHKVTMVYFCKTCEIGSTDVVKAYDHFMNNCPKGFAFRRESGAAQDDAWKCIGMIPAAQLHYQPASLAQYKQDFALNPQAFVTPSICNHRTMSIAFVRQVSCTTCYCLDANYSVMYKCLTGKEYDESAIRKVRVPQPPLAHARSLYEAWLKSAREQRQRDDMMSRHLGQGGMANAFSNAHMTGRF